MNEPRPTSEAPRHVPAPDSDGAARDAEPLGGDPPCWAHLFGEDPGPTTEDMDLSESPGGSTPSSIPGPPD